MLVRRLFLLLLMALPGFGLGGRASCREIRAVWLTTFRGLDWPRFPARTLAEAEAQQRDLLGLLDRLQAAGINVVLFQARLRGTTAYASATEPWDGAFSGTPGAPPPYDPLAFAVAACHARGMELHAWMVAYPLGSAADMRRLGARGLAARRPELCRRAGGEWTTDPAAEGTPAYVAGLCAEVARRYDVDGIHLDYIRYPERGARFDDRADWRRRGRGLSLAGWRRANVTRTVRAVRDSVRAAKPWVKLSCSAVGKHADLPRRSSGGWNARDAVAQDAQAWLREGLTDWLFPMLYFDGGDFYPFALDWQEASGGSPVAAGIGAYRLTPGEGDWPLLAVARQLRFTRRAGMGGQAFFRARFLADDAKGLARFLADDFYALPALAPPLSRIDSTAPSAPWLRVEVKGPAVELSWTASEDPTPGSGLRYNVYRLAEGDSCLGRARALARWLPALSYRCVPALPALRGAAYAVTAIDRFGNESPPAVARRAW